MHRHGRAGAAEGFAAHTSVTADQDVADPRALPHLGGLDGLRAVAVLAVFLFHGGVGWMAGGYLAVSTFFTLSGFLITLLLLREHHRHGTIALKAFWERRVRRLLPAAVLGVALAAGVTAVLSDPGQQRAFLGDGVATLLDLANWRFILAGRSYGALFDAPSTLQHAWSLAIEAQFYWLYPVLAAVVLKALRGSRRGFGVVLAGLTAASLALTRFAGFDHDRIYYGTDTRMAELLIGALFAIVVAGRPLGVRGPWSPRLRRSIGLVGVMAAAALGLCWVTAAQGVAWVDGGGLGLYAVASAAVVLAASLPGTAIATALSVRPLRALGRISYGVYLFHWPILLLLAPTRVPWSEPVRLAVAFGATIGLAIASYRLVEVPIRRRQGSLGRLPLGAVAVTCAAIALVPTLVVTTRAPEAPIALDTGAGGLVSNIDDLGPPTASAVSASGVVAPRSTPTSTDGPTDGPIEPAKVGLTPAAYAAPSRPLRMLVVGDSTAVFLGTLLNTWGSEHEVWGAANYARLGCGVVIGGDGRTPFGEGPIADVCAHWEAEWTEVVTTIRPDVVVFASSYWEATDRRLPGSTVWQHAGDPAFDELIAAGYRKALDVLTSTGAPVIWLDHPPIGFNRTNDAPLKHPQVFEPQRMQRLDELQQQVMPGRSTVRVVATRPFFDAWPAGPFDRKLRPDGIHVDGPDAMPYLDWLGPEILSQYWDVASNH